MMSFPADKQVYLISRNMTRDDIRELFESSEQIRNSILIWEPGSRIYAFSALDQISTAHLEDLDITDKCGRLPKFPSGDYSVRLLQPAEMTPALRTALNIEAPALGSRRTSDASNSSTNSIDAARRASRLRQSSEPEHGAAYNFFAAIGRFFTETIPSLFSRAESQASSANITRTSAISEFRNSEYNPNLDDDASETFSVRSGSSASDALRARTVMAATEANSAFSEARINSVLSALSDAAPRVEPNILVRAWRAIFGAPVTAASTLAIDTAYRARTPSQSSNGSRL